MFTIEKFNSTSSINVPAIKIECGNLIYFDNPHYCRIDGGKIIIIDVHTNLGTFEMPLTTLRNFRCEEVKETKDFFTSSFIVTNIERVSTPTYAKYIYQLKRIC